MPSIFDDLAKRVQDLPGHLGDTGGAIQERISQFTSSVNYAINPDHRHDEEHEKEEDRKREAVRDQHRFRSFARERDGNDVKWYIDGHDYFYALSTILDGAKECIYIADWWLTPELFLRRPCAKFPEWRLDRLLVRKAEQGVKIFIMVYKEVTQTMTMSSHWTKHFLEDCHDNISCVRHPDHLGGEMTMYWSHHEKIVVVDNVVACIGGLDICFGRWDTHNFPLADAHPEDNLKALLGGQDYNNARIQDFQAVDKWASNGVSKLEAPRMPWHDTHTMVTGPAVLDISAHFVERWNFIRGLKYKHKGARYPLLAFPHVLDDESDEPVKQLSTWDRWAGGTKHALHALHPDQGGHETYGGGGHKGSMKVQVCRSSADWSHGILKEDSIQAAYIQSIREATHCLVIENQFFISSTQPHSKPVENQIAAAIVERVLSAARNGQRFKVYIIIPAIPGFAGDLLGSSGTLAIMAATYRTISRGERSIFGQIKKAGYDPNDYILCFNLRSYDRLNSDPDRLEKIARESGVSYYDVQAALSRVLLGDDCWPIELEKNKEVKFALPRRKDSKLPLLKPKRRHPKPIPLRRMFTDGDALTAAGTHSKHEVVEESETIKIKLPELDEAWRILRKFEDVARNDGSPRVADSVAHHAFEGQGSLFDEPWSGTEESERLAYVTEQLYIHCKLLIVDDRKVIIGSANLNDRSMNGDHDSEIALVIEDTDLVETTMNGEPHMATRFAATFRRRLWREHLGLSEPQHCPDPSGEERVTPFMTPVGEPLPDMMHERNDRIVDDPLSDETVNLLKSTAKHNTEAFRHVFHCVPDDNVRTWDQYRQFTGGRSKPGHVHSPDMPAREIKEHLDRVRGHLVEMPLNFLENEDLLAFDASVNPITLDIYL